MKIGIPQAIMLAIVCMNLGMSLALHGQEKQGEYNFWVTLIGMALELSLLYAGGFFG